MIEIRLHYNEKKGWRAVLLYPDGRTTWREGATPMEVLRDLGYEIGEAKQRGDPI